MRGGRPELALQEGGSQEETNLSLRLGVWAFVSLRSSRKDHGQVAHLPQGR